VVASAIAGGECKQDDGGQSEGQGKLMKTRWIGRSHDLDGG
jgi:hypothetical protein